MSGIPRRAFFYAAALGAAITFSLNSFIDKDMTEEEILTDVFNKAVRHHVSEPKPNTLRDKKLSLIHI